MNDKISFEDRVFKLSTGEKVDPSVLENKIENVCHYVKYVTVEGSGEDQPVALIFPNKKLLDQPDYEITPEGGCFCPRSLNELGKCLTGCLQLVNNQSDQKMKSAAIINSDISETSGVSHDELIKKYRTLLQKMHAGNVPSDEEVYIVKLNTGK